MKKSTSAKTCFSYIRFSSGRQSKEFGGTSLERQAEIAPRVAAEKGWVLDESLNIQNLGLSAYKGSNKKTIEGIINAANTGKIQRGTVCIVEALDRLTRLELDDAYQLLRSILKAGVEVYTDNSGRHLTADDLNKPMSVMMTVVELNAAFEHSDKLASRVRKAWQAKRASGKAGQINKNGSRTKVAPHWIDAKTWTVIESKADIVRTMFKMYLEGNGISAIAKHLNAVVPKIPTFNGGKWWNNSYVLKTLQNKIVIGELQPKRIELQTKNDGESKWAKRIPDGEPIKGYYPAIIPEHTFYAVQAKYAKAFKGRVRKAHNCPNVFAGVATCSCGQRMNRVNGGTQTYLYCSAVTNFANTCKQPRINYGAVEQAFLELLKHNPEYLVVKVDASNEVETVSGKIFDLQKRIDNITNAIVDGGANKALVAKQTELIGEKEALELELNVAKSKTVSDKVSADDIKRVVANLKNFKTDVGLRNTVRDFCLSNFTSMVFDNKKRVFTITLKNGKALTFTLAEDYQSVTLNHPVYMHVTSKKADVKIATNVLKIDGTPKIVEIIKHKK